LKILGLAVMVIILVAIGIVFRSLPVRPCAAARAIYENYGNVSGYGTFQGMLAGDFRYLGGHDFIYIENDAHPSRRTKEPRAEFVSVSLGVLYGVSEILTMSVPVAEFYSSKGRPLTCEGDS